MEFYETIASHYDEIFPFKQDAATFLLNTLSEHQKNDPNNQYIDIGCGTGSLVHYMAHHFSKAIGLDLNQKMIQQARQKSNLEAIAFHEENMLQIEQIISSRSVSIISCLGNTLPHLKNKQEVLDFLISCFSCLQEKGKLVLQLINFDRILAKKIKNLPTLKKTTLEFERIYHHKNDEKIIFESVLTTADNKVSSQVDLLILRSIDLKSLIQQAGFTAVNCYGSYTQDPFTIESMPLIIVATK